MYILIAGLHRKVYNIIYCNEEYSNTSDLSFDIHTNFDISVGSISVVEVLNCQK